MWRKFCGWLLKALGWTADAGVVPEDKCIILGVPHTSAWDFLISFFYYYSVGGKASVMVKKEFFWGPLAPIMRWMGGIPVDRKRGATVAKQVIDVHTTMLSQIVAAEFLAWDGYDAHIKNCCDLYGKKAKLMAEMCDQSFPEYITHTNPDGGIFMWCDIDKDVDTKELLAKVKSGVLTVFGITGLMFS